MYATTNNRKRTPVEKPTLRKQGPSLSSSVHDAYCGNQVENTVSVNADVLNVTLMQYVSQKSSPEEPPRAGPRERVIM